MIFPTFTDAENNSAEQQCPICRKRVKKKDFELPALPLAFYGDPSGYHKPSSTKRQSYKTVSTKHGNRDSGA